MIFVCTHKKYVSGTCFTIFNNTMDSCQGPLVKTLDCQVIWRPLQNHPGSFDEASVYSQDPKFFPAEADTHRPDFGEPQQDDSIDPLAVSGGHEPHIFLLCLILGRFNDFLHALSLTISIPFYGRLKHLFCAPFKSFQSLLALLERIFFVSSTFLPAHPAGFSSLQPIPRDRKATAPSHFTCRNTSTARPSTFT